MSLECSYYNIFVMEKLICSDILIGAPLEETQDSKGAEAKKIRKAPVADENAAVDAMKNENDPAS
jgi:hypothetical protein